MPSSIKNIHIYNSYKLDLESDITALNLHIFALNLENNLVTSLATQNACNTCCFKP